MFAPDENQMHVINHLTGSPADGQSRYGRLCNINVLSRIFSVKLTENTGSMSAHEISFQVSVNPEETPSASPFKM